MNRSSYEKLICILCFSGLKVNKPEPGYYDERVNFSIIFYFVQAVHTENLKDVRD